MDAVAVNTGGNVLIAFLRERSTVYAFLIGIVNGAVALGTGLRNGQLCTQQQLTRLFVSQSGLGMRVMAVRADSGIGVAGRQCLLMDAIQHLLILIVMALLTGGIHLQ
jgi:hypothetical protein